MLRQDFGQILDLSLSVERLGEIWDKRVADPYAFTPYAQREQGISVEDAQAANREFGGFAQEHLKRLLVGTTREDKLANLRNRAKIVAVGYGRGYDSQWLVEALSACLETWWIDVSPRACEWARADLDKQMSGLEVSGFEYPKRIIARGEIRRCLEDPTSLQFLGGEQISSLDLSSVRIWYLSRVLGCIAEKGVREILGGIGSTSFTEGADPLKVNRLVLVVALTNDNRHYRGQMCTSTFYTRGLILRTLARGAGRRVRVYTEEKYAYFGQVYTAMTLGAV